MDADGTINTYLFDLDGDGTYELDSDGMPEASTTYATRGRRTVGVQVLDDSGAAAFATFDVNVSRAASRPDTRPPLSTFKLSRKTFGGGAARTLLITYRLREKARVEVKLRRGAGSGKLVRLIDRGVRKRNRYHRIRLRPARLKRGRYVVRIFVQAASGKRQVAPARRTPPLKAPLNDERPPGGGRSTAHMPLPRLRCRRGSGSPGCTCRA